MQVQAIQNPLAMLHRAVSDDVSQLGNARTSLSFSCL